MFQWGCRLYFLFAIQFFLYSSAKVEEVQVRSLPSTPLRLAAILQDADNRIDDRFSVPPLLIPRVAFWLDVYTQYGFEHRIIHHENYPWWIAEVVDVKAILEAPSRALWLKHERAKKFSIQKLNEHRRIFSNLAKKVKKGLPLTDTEAKLLKRVENLPGPVAKNLRELPAKLRIQTGQKNFFIEGLQKSTRYLEFMEKIFVDYELPKELTRLPLVESSFNESAGSKVGALGIWQLMPAVSHKFIMVNDQIDERRSPYKATYIAARLFRENHRILKGAWPLVITAYNHGPGGMIRATKKLNTQDFATIIDQHHSASFGFASENFYCEFLAALIAQNYSTEFFGDLVSRDFYHVQAVSLPRRIKVRELVFLSQMPAEEFLSFNPDLKKAYRVNLRLPRGFTVFIPQESLRLVLDGLNRRTRVAGIVSTSTLKD